MKALALSHPPLKHANVLGLGIWSLVLVVRSAERWLIRLIGKQRGRLDQVGNVMQNQTIPLGAVLPLNTLAASRIDQVWFKCRRSFHPFVNGPRSDLALDLIPPDADEPIRQLGRLGWKARREARLQSGNAANMPTHLRFE